ncbi:MAG: EAL domain-containing protein, partial [Burkholderiaceae bacterium]
RAMAATVGKLRTLFTMPNGDLIVGRRDESGVLVIAEIPAQRIALLLELPGRRHAPRVTLSAWVGGQFFDSANGFGASDRDPPGMTAQGGETAIAWSSPAFRVVEQSQIYPLMVTLHEHPAAVDALVLRTVVIALLVALVGMFAGASVINLTLQDRFSPLRRLRLALAAAQFEPVVQPIVAADTGHCLGGEILMRWRHPSRGLLLPADFLPIAEQSGLIGPMTWQIVVAARAAISRALDVDPTLVFSFNFPASMILDPDFEDRLQQHLGDSNIAPCNLAIELLERDVVEQRTREVMEKLRAVGYRVSIDDFGTGQSGLSVLSKIPFDTLKIDREFVRSIDEESVNRPVLLAIIELARTAGARAIAEGVETPAQHGYLLAQGVQALQGFLIARPMPMNDFALWLAANRHRPTYADRRAFATVAPVAAPVGSTVPASADEPSLATVGIRPRVPTSVFLLI